MFAHLIGEDDTRDGDRIMKVSVQLQSLSEVSLCPGQQGASPVTDDRAGG